MCSICNPEEYSVEILEDDDPCTEADKLNVLDMRDELDFVNGGICPFCGESYGGNNESEDY